MDARITSRRAVLNTLALAVPVAMTAITASPAAAAIDRKDWNRAFAAMERARVADEAINATYMRTYASFLTDFPAVETLGARNSDAFRANDLDAYEAEWMSQRGTTWNGDHFEQIGRREIAEVREWRGLRDAANRRHNFDAVETEWEQLGDVLYDAQWALFKLPAPDLAALHWKSEHLFGETADNNIEATAWSAGIITTYMADVRRLISGGTGQ